MQNSKELVYIFCPQRHEYASSLFECGLHIMNFLQRLQYRKDGGEGEINFTVAKSDKTTAKWSRSTPILIVMLIVSTFNILWWKWPLVSMFFFLLQTHNSSLTMRKIPCNSQLIDILQNTWPELLKIKIIHNEESPRRCHNPEKPKEKWQLNVM